MSEGRGKHFDPKLLGLFLDHLDEAESIQRQYREEPAEQEGEGSLMERR